MTGVLYPHDRGSLSALPGSHEVTDTAPVLSIFPVHNHHFSDWFDADIGFEINNYVVAHRTFWQVFRCTA
jgi:hypothetical protein